MKKHTFLTSLVAISMSCAAHAATDLDTNVTFAGDYSNTDGTITGNIATKPGGESYTYQSTDKDGNLVSNTATYNSDTDTGVSAANFKYQTADGTETNLSENANPDMASYKATSNVDGTTIKLADDSTDVVYNGSESLSKELYQYKDSNDEWVSLAKEPVSNTDVILSNGQTITVTNGKADKFSGELYSFELNGVTYVLSEDGSSIYKAGDPNKEGVPVIADTSLATQFSDIQATYNTDKILVDSAKDNTGAENTANQVLYDAAIAVFEQDSNLFNDQKAKYATAEAATAQWTAVTDATNPAWATAMADNSTKSDLYTKATDLYNTPIVDTVTAGANAAIDSALADGGVINEKINDAVSGKQETLTGDKLAAVESGINADKVSVYDSHTGNNDIHVTAADKDIWNNKQDALTGDNLAAVESGIDAAKVAQIETNKSDIATNSGLIAANTTAIETNVGNIAANTTAITTEVAAREAGDALTLLQAQSYADTQDALMLGQAKAYADAQNTMMLKSANDYTDHKVNSLEKELSAGIASATALSSVAVSDVKKGEMSVGGGYGYYNSQSAIALGAALGITDNWSVNAGAGFADSNVSFRAGTNYKFKLF